MEKIVINVVSLEELRSAWKEDFKKTIESYLNILPSENDTLLSRKEAANILKISLPSLDSWTNKGLIKAYRIGNGKRYKKSDILNSLNLVKVNKYRRDNY